jgi:hypothetical protein
MSNYWRRSYFLLLIAFLQLAKHDFSKLFLQNYWSYSNSYLSSRQATQTLSRSLCRLRGGCRLGVVLGPGGMIRM